MSFDALASSLTLTGSVLSCVGSGCIIICFIHYYNTQRSFRHALVFNLAVSDFVNSLTNCISGSIYIANHKLVAGTACTFNGWIEQISVQATDFSILAISIATLLVVTGRTRLDSIPTSKRVLLCLAVWIMPLVSSTTVTALGEMKPVSGNWCWISEARPDLRYGLAHGWRFLIILLTICMYTYIYVYLSRHFKSLVALRLPVFMTTTRRVGADDTYNHHQLAEVAKASHTRIQVSSLPHAQTVSLETDIKRMLLLNGYPIMYIILWIPGLTNRALEASGRASSSEVLAALQCSTQFVGFANALTYGLNREMRQILGRDLKKLLFGKRPEYGMENIDSN